MRIVAEEEAVVGANEQIGFVRNPDVHNRILAIAKIVSNATSQRVTRSIFPQVSASSKLNENNSTFNDLNV